MPLILDTLPRPDHITRKAALITIQICLLVISLLVFGLRIYTRARILRSLGPDDWIMGAALIVSIALAVNSCISTKFGWAGHVSAIPIENFSPLLLCVWLSELLFTISTSLVKISILFFYLRLAVTRVWRRVMYGSIAFIVLWMIAFGFLIIFQCTPVEGYWNPATTSCTRPETALFLHGLTNTITDLYVYVLPMRLVWNLQLPKRQRIALIVLFAAGFIVCVAGAVRLYFSIITQHSNDSPWEGFYMYTWESIEVNLGIVCASVPCLKALVKRLSPKFMGSGTGSSTATGAAAHYRLSERRGRNINGRRDDMEEHILGSAGVVGRGSDRAKYGEIESQEDLTKSHPKVQVSKISSNQIG